MCEADGFEARGGGQPASLRQRMVSRRPRPLAEPMALVARDLRAGIAASLVLISGNPSDVFSLVRSIPTAL